MHDRHRPHSAIGSRPPISRLRMDKENLLKRHNDTLAGRWTDSGPATGRSFGRDLGEWLWRA